MDGPGDSWTTLDDTEVLDGGMNTKKEQGSERKNLSYCNGICARMGRGELLCAEGKRHQDGFILRGI